MRQSSAAPPLVLRESWLGDVRCGAATNAEERRGRSRSEREAPLWQHRKVKGERGPVAMPSGSNRNRARARTTLFCARCREVCVAMLRVRQALPEGVWRRHGVLRIRTGRVIREKFRAISAAP